MSVEEDFNGLTLCLCNIEGFDTLSTDSLLAIIPLIFGLPLKQLSATSCELKVSGSLEISLTEVRFYYIGIILSPLKHAKLPVSVHLINFCDF